MGATVKASAGDRARIEASRADLLSLLRADPVELAKAGDLLDAASREDRVALARSIPGDLQARLFEAARAAAPLTIDDLVPSHVLPWATVRHFGRNSLPLFTLFEKRFCRPGNGREMRRVYGYNHQPMMWLTGPGCMVAYEGERGELLIDYRELPERVPEGWPSPRPNDSGMSRFVYKNMVDHLRRVSRHVTIGRAFRNDRPEDNYFVLCRAD